MRLGIVGSRSWQDWELFKRHGRAWLRKYPDLHIVSGWCEDGADSMAELFAKTYRTPFTAFPAKWKLEDGSTDRGAGFDRNTVIVAASQAILAFWDGSSPGTADTCVKALKWPMPCWVVKPDGHIYHGSELVVYFKEKKYPAPVYEPLFDVFE